MTNAQLPRERFPAMEEQQEAPSPDICIIAVVDDDAAVCDSISLLLETCGFKVITYLSGADFLTDNPKISLLLVDFNMPGMNGLELVQHLRSNGNPVPVYLITATSDPKIASRAEALGVKGVLEKPLGNTLVAMVQEEFR